MQLYFWDCRQVPDGYKRIFYISKKNQQPFREEAIILLAKELRSDICFPAPDQFSFLVMSKDTAKPTLEEFSQLLGKEITCQEFFGGIFNPLLPVRPYDVWFD